MASQETRTPTGTRTHPGGRQALVTDTMQRDTSPTPATVRWHGGEGGKKQELQEEFLNFLNLGEDHRTSAPAQGRKAQYPIC